ncbi:MAG TPA: secondary thiamine-phosphate synthase enzyme YjbQ [Polyangiaceae bacterium]|nr:secondary thiamine-phosphate synthase enzyme YjbQ [Polyangiaceae bacterium]
MKTHQAVLEVATRGRGFANVTERVEGVVRASGVRTGLCVVFCQHTSASLVIQENADPAVLRDLERWLSELAPEARAWEHDAEGPDDMPAHAKSAVTRASETLPVANGELALGTWQALYVWEHRARAHSRRLLVTVQGD